MSTYQNTEKVSVPWLSFSAIIDERSKISLSENLLNSAQVSQPWSMIGLDQWIEAGRWWFLRSRMELFAVSKPGQEVSVAAYINLIKASWILVDIIACHPQRYFMTIDTDAEVRVLAIEIKSEFARLSSLDSIFPSANVLDRADVRIWETTRKGSFLRTCKDSQGLEWTTDSRDLLMFKKYSVCYLQSHTDPLPCIMLFLIRRDARDAKIVAQNQNGLVIMTVAFKARVVASDDVASDDNVCVRVNGEKLVFTNPEDARYLCCLVEATNFYLFDRGSDTFSLKDLLAYMLLFAVKSQWKDVVSRLLQRPPFQDLLPSIGHSAELLSVASSVVSRYLSNNLKKHPQWRNAPISLWAVACGHTSVVRYLLDEKVSFDKDLL